MKPSTQRKAGTNGDLAAMLGVSAATLTGYSKQSSFPAKVPHSRGHWPLLEVCLWWAEHHAGDEYRMLRVGAPELYLPDSDLDREEQLLDLQLKANKVSVQNADVVDPDLLANVLGEFVSATRQLLGETNDDVQIRFAEFLDRFIEGLDVEIKQLQKDSLDG